MHDQSEPIGLLARLTADPLRTRRFGAIALLVCTPLAAFAHTAGLGFATAMLAALCWVMVPFIALAIGNGDAFFLRYGRGRRRVLITLLAAVLLSLSACVVLAGLSDSSLGARAWITSAAGYGLLYLSLTMAVAGVISIIFGYGRNYISGRIMRMSDEDW